MNNLELIRAAQRGDLLAFNRLVLEYQETVFNLAYRVLCDEFAAAEAAQATFLDAYQDLRRYHQGSFQVWLMQKAIQVCRQKLHHNGHSAGRVLHQGLTVGEEQDLQRCLGALSPEDRLVLVLVDIQGFDYVQAAHALETSPKKVQNQLALARQQLMDHMTGSLPAGGFIR